MRPPYGVVEDLLTQKVLHVVEEDEHLDHGAGWARELWIDSLGLPAVLPPPEGEHDVNTAIEAAEAKAAREESL